MNDHTAACTSPFTSMFYFLAGGLTGAGVALLLAPQSGRATREMIRRTANDTAGTTRDLKDQVIRRGQQIRDEAKHRVDDAVAALSGDGGAKLSG